MRELLKMPEPPDSILIIGNTMLRGALAVKTEMEASSVSGVKRDTLLTGCVERNLNLTPVTILQPIDELGKSAVRLLIDIIQGIQTQDKCKTVDLPPMLDVSNKESKQ